MNEIKYRKPILVCRIVTIISAFFSLVLMFYLFSAADKIENWTVIQFIAAVLTVGVFAPPFGITYFRIKIKSQKKDDEIQSLKQEIEQLKRNIK